MMKYYTLYEVVFPVCYLAVGLFLLTIGVNGLLRKRAVVYPGYRGYAVLVLFLLPLFFTCINLVFLGPRSGGPDINEFGLIAIPVLLVVAWSRFRGVHVLGLSKQSLSKVLEAGGPDSIFRVRSVWGFGQGCWQVQAQGSENLTKKQIAALRDTVADYQKDYVLNIVLGLILSIAGILVRILS
jgi:hypothetical protein